MQNRDIHIVSVTSKAKADQSANEYKQEINNALIASQKAIANKGIDALTRFAKDLYPKLLAEVLKKAKGEENDIEAAGNNAQDAVEEAQKYLDQLLKDTDAYAQLEQEILVAAKKLEKVGNDLAELEQTQANEQATAKSSNSPGQQPTATSVTNNQSSLYKSQSSASRTRSEVVTENKNGGCCVVM